MSDPCKENEVQIFLRTHRTYIITKQAQNLKFMGPKRKTWFLVDCKLLSIVQF